MYVTHEMVNAAWDKWLLTPSSDRNWYTMREALESAAAVRKDAKRLRYEKKQEKKNEERRENSRLAQEAIRRCNPHGNSYDEIVSYWQGVSNAECLPTIQNDIAEN
jgi:hypothetical protein